MRVRFTPWRASGASRCSSAPGPSVPVADTSIEVLSLPLERKQLAAHDDEARGVVRLILDAVEQDAQRVDLCGRLARERGGAVLVACAAGGFGVARDGNLLDVRQVLREPPATLRERLRMRAHAADLSDVLHATHQVLMDAQLDLAAHLERRRQEHVERVDVDGAFARILDRRHAEVGGARLDLVEDFVDRRRPTARARNGRSA